jgi:hypothetical protein
MMSITWLCNGIAEFDLESVETVKMKGVLYYAKIAVAAKILPGGTYIPVLKRSSFTGAVKR